VSESAVRVPADGALVEGDLTVPADADGIIVFAHGSGSGRLSPRNRAVATARDQRPVGCFGASTRPRRH
jgi:hypothetical protein